MFFIYKENLILPSKEILYNGFLFSSLIFLYLLAVVLFLRVALLCNIKKYIYIDINYNMRPGGFHIIDIKIKNIFSFL